MKLGAVDWCKVQAAIANLRCPRCFKVKVKLTEEGKENAKCEDCGCQFEFDPDVDINVIE